MDSSSRDSQPSAVATKSRCVTAVRVPLFILNLVTWICGGGLIGLGIWVVATNNDYKHFTENKDMFIVYIALGAVLFTAGFFGACGALMGNKVLLKLYFTMVCLVFCGLFGLVVFGLIQKNLVGDIVQDSWNKTSDETRMFIQDKFDCCGIGDNVTYNHPSNLHNSCFVNITTREAKQNCFSKLVDWFKEHQLTISLFASSIMVLMVALMVSSCYVLHQLGTSKREIKRNRVVPITVNENDGTQMSNFTEERPREERRRQSDMQDEIVAANEETDEGRYSSRKKGKQPRSHKSNKRESWAKNNTMLA